MRTTLCSSPSFSRSYYSFGSNLQIVHNFNCSPVRRTVQFMCVIEAASYEKRAILFILPPTRFIASLRYPFFRPEFHRISLNFEWNYFIVPSVATWFPAIWFADFDYAFSPTIPFNPTKQKIVRESSSRTTSRRASWSKMTCYAPGTRAKSADLLRS